MEKIDMGEEETVLRVSWYYKRALPGWTDLLRQN